MIFEEILYEGYAPGGVAVIAEVVTDNRNRTTPEIRTIFSKNGGNLGETGSVGYLFDKKGLFVIEGGKVTEDEIIELLMDYDVDDVKTEDGNIIVTTSPEGYYQVSDVLLKKGFTLLENQLGYIPQTTVALDEKKATQCLRITELLEDHDDVQQVYSNFDISDEIMAKLGD